VIHRFWDGPGEPPYKNFTGLLTRREVTDWTMDTLPVAIKTQVEELDHLAPEGRLERHRSNIARVLLLIEFGGVWIDYDVLLLKPLPDQPVAFTAGVGGEVCSCVMSFPKGDRRLRQVMEGLKARTETLTTLDSVLAPAVNSSVWVRDLPFDSNGNRAGLDMWAVHLWGTSHGE
jgi:hypothetical protein